MLEPREPAITERGLLLTLILRYLVPKEGRLCLESPATERRYGPLSKQPLRECDFKRRVSLQALLLTRGLRRCDLLVKMAIPSTQNLPNRSLSDGLAERLLKPLAEGLL